MTFRSDFYTAILWSWFELLKKFQPDFDRARRNKVYEIELFSGLRITTRRVTGSDNYRENMRTPLVLD